MPHPSTLRRIHGTSEPFVAHPDVARFQTSDRYSLGGVTAASYDPRTNYMMAYQGAGACKWPTPIICADGRCVSSVTMCESLTAAGYGNRFQNPPPMHYYRGNMQPRRKRKVVRKKRRSNVPSNPVEALLGSLGLRGRKRR